MQENFGTDIASSGNVASGGFRPITPPIDIPITTEMTTDYTEIDIAETEIVKPITPSPSNVKIITIIFDQLKTLFACI